MRPNFLLQDPQRFFFTGTVAELVLTVSSILIDTLRKNLEPVQF